MSSTTVLFARFSNLCFDPDLRRCSMYPVHVILYLISHISHTHVQDLDNVEVISLVRNKEAAYGLHSVPDTRDEETRIQEITNKDRFIVSRQFFGLNEKRHNEFN